MKTNAIFITTSFGKTTVICGTGAGGAWQLTEINSTDSARFYRSYAP